MNGKKLSLEVITASDRSSWQSATVNMLITNCKEAGIEITWNPMEKTAMWDTCYDGNPGWQLIIDGWGGDADPGFIMCIFRDYEDTGSFRQSIPKDGKDTKQGKTVSSETNSITTTATSN